MNEGRKTIVVSAVNIRKGGTLTILRDCLSYLSSLPAEEYRIVALVHRKSLAEYPGIEYIEKPDCIKGWLRRLWCEYVTMHRISKELQPVDLWFSLHDTTPRVIARRQAVYCQTSFPFFKWKMQDLRFDVKIVLFALFTRFAYQANIKRNRYLVVQTDWLRDGFSKMFGIPKERFIVCPPERKPVKYTKMDIGHEVYTFIFVSTPDCHKNFETLCQAASELEHRVGSGRFKVVLTIKGDENKYSRWLHDRFVAVSSIDFEGLMPKDKLYSYYECADCLVFPSRVETWGLPITEFAPTGKPMLLADLPYAHETAGGCRKVAFFDSESPADLADKMEALLQSAPSVSEQRHDSILSPVPAKTIAPPLARTWRDLFDQLLKDED